MPHVGYKHTDAARRAISIAKRGVPFSAERKVQHGVRQREVTSADSYRKKMSEVKKGVPMPLDSPNGASEKNKNAKDWWLIKNQIHYRFRSVSKFVRDNKHLFTEDELTEYKTESRPAKVYRATVMLRQLLLLKKDGTPVISNHEWAGWTIGDKWAQGFYEQKEKLNA